jgi:hypothetical protein
MTKEEFQKILIKPINECNGFEVHLQHCWRTENTKSIFYLTGIDFTDMFGPYDWQKGWNLSTKNKEQLC